MLAPESAERGEFFVWLCEPCLILCLGPPSSDSGSCGGAAPLRGGNHGHDGRGCGRAGVPVPLLAPSAGLQRGPGTVTRAAWDHPAPASCNRDQ